MDLRGLKMSGQHRVQDWSKIVFVDVGGLNIWQHGGCFPVRYQRPTPGMLVAHEFLPFGAFAFWRVSWWVAGTRRVLCF